MKTYYIVKSTTGQTFKVYPEHVTGRYNWNGGEMISFTSGHLTYEGEIISTEKEDEIYDSAPVAKNQNTGSGINKGLLYAAGLGLAALLWLV